MSSPEIARLEKFREHLRREWTDEKTVAAWRKWQGEILTLTRGATEALLKAAQLRPGMRVLDLASGVGDPALSVAEAVGPSGRVTATDLGPGMISLAEELARKKGLANIEFRVAGADSLPFPDASYDAVTCRFGLMFFPDLGAALRECLRVLKPGGRATFVAWGPKEQPFFAVTSGVLLKYVTMPPPDPDAPNLFMFGERGRLRRELEATQFRSVEEETRTVSGRWMGTLEGYWEQFSEVAAPFRPLIEKLTPQTKAEVIAESLAALKKYWDGVELNIPLEIVVGSGTRA